MSDESYSPESYIKPEYGRGNGTTQVVSNNERQVLSEVWNTPGLTRSALGAKLDLTQQSVYRIITQLEERGMLRLGELEPPVYKGKPSPQLQLNPRYTCSVGISVNTDSAGVTVMDFVGNHETRSIETDSMTMSETLAQIDRQVAEVLAETGFGWEDVFGIGFAIAGFLVEDTRFNAPEPLSEWSAVPLGPILAQRYDRPVWTENGANTGALCERMLGVGRTVENFVYLSFNYGFGGGVILDGELMRGGFGNAGELSGLFTPEERPHRPRLRSLLEMLQAHDVDVRTIADLTRRFDITWPGVSEWLDRVCDHHSRVINVLAAVVDPEVIVFGGQIPPPLAEAMMNRTRLYSAPRHGVYRKMPRLSISEIQGETAAIGAASLPLKEIFF